MFDPAAGPAKPDVVRRALITNRRGLHARAAAKFVKTAERFSADIMVVRLEGAELKSTGEEVSGRSIMGLMMLAAAPGTTIELRATGSDAAAALDALTQLVEAKFDED
jgi:phosphocarrier protein